MRIILLLLALELFAFALSPQSCYTVQIISAVKNSKNYEKLSQKSYDQSCRILEIGSMYTVRCGCFDAYKQAKQHLSKIKKNYKKSTIVTTYKSRFSKREEEIKKQSSIVVHPSTVETIVAPAVEVVAAPTTASAIVVPATPLIADVKKKHKKHKKVKKKEKITLKSEKKEKKKKKKYYKKREKRFFYDRYIRKLKHEERGRGKYDYRYAFGGQISYDIAYIDEADKNYDDRGLRRFRLWHDGSFFHKKLFYEFEYSFTGSSQYKDVYVGYEDKLKTQDLKYRVKIGNLKIPFSLERYTSSKYNTFMERSLMDAFSISRKLGGEFLLAKSFNHLHWNLFGAYFTNSINERLDDEVNQPGFSTRVTLSKKESKYKIMHLGFGWKQQDYRGESIKLKQGAESDWIQDKYVSTKIKHVDTVNTFNLEAMGIYNKYYMQAEYSRENVSADKGDYSFYAYYLQGSYFLIGEGKRYKVATATMAKIKPRAEGALELAMRYSYINLTDKDEQGGQQQDVTLGVNWYIDDKLKVSANYILANPIDTEDYDGIFQVWQARVLFFF